METETQPAFAVQVLAFDPVAQEWVALLAEQGRTVLERAAGQHFSWGTCDQTPDILYLAEGGDDE